MQAIIFIGIQASGKSTFYKNNFFQTHIRINMDMLKTRHREKVLLETCIQLKQPFVVDNTNPTIEDRARYIVPAKQGEFQIVGYYFQSKISDSLSRNKERRIENQIPEKGILGTYTKLVRPDFKEGFDKLYYVNILPELDFSIEDWNDEV